MTLAEYAAQVGGSVSGDGSVEIERIAAIEDVDDRSLTFATDERYLRNALASRAAAVLTEAPLAERVGAARKPLLIVPSARAALAQLLAALEPRSNCRVAGRTREQSLQQRPQIKARSADHHRHAPALLNLTQHVPCYARIFSGGEDLIGINHIDQMMRHALPRSFQNFRGPDVEAPVNLHRVAIHDLATHRQRNVNGQIALARRGRPQHNRQRNHSC